MFKDYMNQLDTFAQKKQSRMIVLVLMILLVIFVPPLISNSEEEVATLRMATTTSTADTGLLDALSARALKDLNINLEYIAVGTGEALAIGRSGDVDLLLVHDPVGEKQFVEAGFGVERVLLMYNDFVVVGPAGILSDTDDLEDAFATIVDLKATFVSRGDHSGTHRMELRLWEAFGIDPHSNPNYIEAGQGMGATLHMANELKAFTLTDRGTWLSQSHTSDMPFEIQIISEGDSLLKNQYGIIVINPKVHQGVNDQLASKFVDWMVSPEIQEFIRMFGVDTFGESLFFPNPEKATFGFIQGEKRCSIGLHE